MPTRKESGLLVLLDEGYFQRLDSETEIRRAALRTAGAKAWKVPRTQVVRDLLRHALDWFAHERGDVVPIAEPVSPEELQQPPEDLDTWKGAPDLRPQTVKVEDVEELAVGEVPSAPVIGWGRRMIGVRVSR